MRDGIKVEFFEEWLMEDYERRYASSYGGGSQKEIFVNSHNIIKVRDHNMIVYEGKNIVEAVKVYNNCK